MNNRMEQFHYYYDKNMSRYGYGTNGKPKTVTKHFIINERTPHYKLFAHFHPYCRQLIQRLIQKSLLGLEGADTEYIHNPDGSFVLLPNGKPKPVLYEDFMPSTYNPSDLVQQPYPVKDLDFSSSGAYAVYNWELFFHVPLTLAIHLSKNGRYEDALTWFHFVFDPTDDSDGPTPERFWKVKPFQFTEVKMIEDILVNLSTGADPQLWQDTLNSINAWQDNPFQPHLVARYRQSAYMIKTVMAYIDNLIAWGDSLFQSDDPENVDEAALHYIQAANILGAPPQLIPPKGSVQSQNYASLRTKLSAFGNALVDIETAMPFDTAPHPNNAVGNNQNVNLRSLGTALYFCVPPNDKLLGYWTTVADRLFKIRNSLNFQGIFRQLPLFAPPIDPALLASAAALGLDISAIVNGLNQPLPLVRFVTLLQKATEICNEVKSLGNNLLSAMEKEDNEALAILRAKHESAILELTEAVKYAQWQEAIKVREGLEQSLDNAIQRYIYYERQLGKQPSEIKIPELEALDNEGLLAMKFKMQEPKVPLHDINIQLMQPIVPLPGGLKLSPSEAQELDLLEFAQVLQDSASAADLIGSVLSVIPEFGGRITPWGLGAKIDFGGQELSRVMSFMSSVVRTMASRISYEANRTAKTGSYLRREQEWTFQSNSGAGEINSAFKQLRAAQIREAIAERELKNHRQQITNAQDIERFLNADGQAKNGKKANQALYTWMRREVKGLYGQVFQFAFDIAKKAERALQHEIGDTGLTFIRPGYLTGKEGLLAGEKLFYDIKRMELAYHDLNAREYELTKSVSLLQLDPEALLQLRMTGQCSISLPETLFDLDTPGQYFRRIKSVAVSVLGVTGPYTSINCTLTLLKSSIRINALLNPEDGTYTRRPDADDSRFSDHFGSNQSIVTSSAQTDSGLFETNLHDERYLPFEGSGVISSWALQLPANPKNGDPMQFDYNTISDVIIQVRYTAREGGKLLRSGAMSNLKTLIENAEMAGSVRLFSVRYEFPTEWAKFKNAAVANTFIELSLPLREEHYPFWSQGRLAVITQADLYARTTETAIRVAYKADGTGDADGSITNDKLGGLLAISLDHQPSDQKVPIGKFTIYLEKNTLIDLWLAVTWGKNA